MRTTARKKIQLGDEVVCKVTGFKGMVVAEASYLFGCQQFWVQPKVDSKGGWAKAQWIDAPQLKTIPKPKPRKKPKYPMDYGGDREHPPPDDDLEE